MEDKVLKYWYDGMSSSEIALELEIPKSEVIEILRDHGEI